MNVRTFRLAQLRNDEHFQFGGSFQSLVEKTGAVALKIAPQFTIWQSLYAQEDIALKKIMKSALTEKIEDADKHRDRIFRSLADANKAALNHFDTVVCDAAKRLKIVFDTYGNVAQKALNEETSALYNLLADLKSSAYTADVATVGLTSWLTPLEESNNVVNALIESRYDETTARTNLVLSDVRAQIDAQYNVIIELLAARSLTETNPTPFVNFIERWNTVVQKYEDAVDNRYGKSAAAKSHKADANAAALADAQAALTNAQADAQAAIAAAAADPGNIELQNAAGEAVNKVKKIQAEIEVFTKEA